MIREGQILRIHLQIVLCVIGYSLLYFIMTTLIYFYSMSNGYNGLGLPVFGGGDDGHFYYEQAVNFINGVPYVFTSIHVWILGCVMKFFNTDDVIFLRFFNYFANLALLTIGLLLLKKIVIVPKTYSLSAVILVFLLAFYPSLLLNSTLSIYRDVWIYTFFLWSMYLFMNIFIKKGKWPRIVSVLLLIFTMIMLGGYRRYALLSFMVGSAVYLLLKVFNKRKISVTKFLLIMFVGISIFYQLFRNFKLPVVGLSFTDVLNYRQLGLEAGGSQMGISLDQPNIIMFYLNYIYSLISNFIGPLPWQITGGSTLVLMVTEGFIFICISIFLLRKYKNFSNSDMYLLIQSFIWFLLISVSNDNFGTAARLRIVGWLPLIILFVKFYGEHILRKRTNKRLDLQNER